ncbi:hypothetical protein FO519_001100 [Halicephalobus sp. NKZ332]|nr:hypothetical protein FO519_001100 [Halicephalobus sp. NKZ332]
MFHSLAPTGLSPPTNRKILHFDHDVFNKAFLDFVLKFHNQLVQTGSVFDIHAYLLDLIKFVKKLMTEGLLEKYESFWPFVMNFLPVSERKRILSLSRRRSTAVFWIKDAIEEKTLVFQLRGFALASAGILNRYYTKNALIRKPCPELLDALDDLFCLDISFCVSQPVITISESLPIAEVLDDRDDDGIDVSQFPGLKRRQILSASPIHVNNLIDHSELIGGDFPTSRSLVEMTRDLPPVDIHDVPNGPYDAHYSDIICDDTKSNTVNEDDRLTSSCTSEESPAEDSKNPVNESEIVHSNEEEDEVAETTPEISTELAVDSAQEDYSCSELISGEFVFDHAEVVTLGLHLFAESGERYQSSFKVFMGHATGFPGNRILVITDRFLYVFTYNNDNQNKYQVIHSVKLNMIDYFSVGTDYQNITVHCRGQKFRSDNSEHVLKNFNIETASMQLGKKIVWCIKKACLESMPKGEIPQAYTHGTENALTLQRFMNETLKANIAVSHHTLIYWKEVVSTGQTDEIEGYIRIRRAKSGLFKSMGEWNEVYASLKGGIFYQFTDSSCKEAIAVTHLRGTISCVFEAELQNDEKYVLQVSSTNQDGEFQVACATMEEMRRWMQAINLSLDVNVQDISVPCTLTVCSSSIVLAQEGDNFSIDGFMRGLKIFKLKDVSYFLTFSKHSIFSVILVNRDLSTDWFFVRNDSELCRLEQTLREAEVDIKLLECDRDYPFLLPHLQRLQNPFVQE